MTTFNQKTDWSYEGNVSNKLAKHLQKHSYTTKKHNSVNVRARGVDIIAEKDGVNELTKLKQDR